MAETFLFNITERVLSKLGSLALDEVSLAWDIKTELKRLENTLSTLRAVILDADEQQAKNHEVRDWLEKLKDVVYDVDGLLDDFSTQLLLRNVKIRPSLLKQVINFFSLSNNLAFRFKIVHKAKEIRKRLDDIAADRRNFHFSEQVVAPNVETKVREQTHSFVRASDIIGRDSDKEFIVELLLSSNDHENISIIPIVGLGGLGKTTLVKLVYSDNRIVRNFELRMWVCVSEDFSLKMVIEKILKSATGESYGHLDMDQIQIRLRDVLNAKRYLLVLDDVWNDDRNKWIELRDLLMNGTSGSTIVVTTRNKAVATITGTISPYNLMGLSDDDCLSLFLRCAFRGEDNWLPNLVEIGKEIVKKCGGVPLAVKTLGSLLYMKTEESEWLHIRDNDIWKIEQKESDILPILRLSYDQMPPYLRQCFVYCSMFPKGNEIPREVFINLWIAQGFIHSPNGNRQLEDVGNLYFNELLSRFCFQDVAEAFDGEILACKIHNLVHDLAQSVAGEECSNVKFDTKFISDRVRHILFDEEDLSGREFPESLRKGKKMRTFSYSVSVKPIGKSFVETITSSFRHLRVLVLNYLELEELPRSIGKLRQLRYLNLSHNCNIKALPNSICKLVNLQTLNVINCEKLQTLPRDIGKLISLKTLYLTSQQMSLPKKGRQSLNSLQYLLLYKCASLKLLSEGFQHFTSLRVLRIYECPRLASLPSSIRHLTALEKLWIWDCEELNLWKGEGMEGLRSLRSVASNGAPEVGYSARRT
ncbi:hypothetical protein F0562_015635 [Nyssa sinensis]|uniref:Disease resistance protein RGA3 n=1 Tax=Nyssa sinensis TaxID=561372 RepID=A0A5J4ZM53_9ASTE|nr:hypothetical protein F0562_015635 [Nyssa sinensis]